MQAYLVSYDTGECDDYWYTNVCVYLGSQAKRQAEAHAAKANDWLRIMGYHRDTGCNSVTTFSDNPFDSGNTRTVDYPGASYAALGPYPVLTQVPR